MYADAKGGETAVLTGPPPQCAELGVGRAGISLTNLQDAAGSIGQSAAAESRLKRAIDIVLAGAALLFFLPFLLVTAALIRLESPGPAIFRQRRGGLGGEEFEIYKFRTMVVQSGQSTPKHATKRDPRLTRLGGFLRRSSLDELPQLFNVLQGHMSIVGPRPHALEHDEYYGVRVPGYWTRMRARPGLTGLAQISGYRGEIRSLDDMLNRVACDIEYIDGWTIKADLKIILVTLLRLPFDPLAY